MQRHHTACVVRAYAWCCVYAVATRWPLRFDSGSNQKWEKYVGSRVRQSLVFFTSPNTGHATIVVCVVTNLLSAPQAHLLAGNAQREGSPMQAA